MRYVHTRCGGTIDIKTRTCLKCKKHWRYWSWWFNLKDIRMAGEPGDYKRRVTKQEELTTVESLIKERVPGGFVVVSFSRLFQYPRQKWARALIVVMVVVGVIGLIWWRL